MNRHFHYGLHIAIIAVAGAFVPLQAAEFYVDPVAGSEAGDGSAASPWRSLQQVIDTQVATREWASYPYQDGTALVAVNSGGLVKAGDTVWLLDGFHGDLDIRNAYNASVITLAAAPGHQPRLSGVFIRSAQHWYLSGMSISPEHGATSLDGSLVNFDSHGFSGPAMDIMLADSDVFTVADASNWDADQWINTARSGVSIDGFRIRLTGTQIRNVRFGITVSSSASDAFVSENIVDGFSADGIRGLGDGATYQFNRIQNVFVSSGQGDGNHDDGFQSWSVGDSGVGTGAVRDVVLRSNIFINYTDANHPLQATMQGIGCFDGRFVNWTVENNIVITDHWHGISFFGMDDSRIVNNTVIDLNDDRPGPPWIQVTDHKNGSPSNSVVVRNNLATQYRLSRNQITDDHNVDVDDPDTVFVAAPYDVHLLADSIAVDAGTASGAPTVDLEGTPRNLGASPDAGALEFCANCSATIFFDSFEISGRL